MTTMLWGVVGALALVGALTGNWLYLAGAVVAVLIYRHWPGSSVGGVVLGAGVLAFALSITAQNVVLGAPGSALVALAGAAAAGAGLWWTLSGRKRS